MYQRNKYEYDRRTRVRRHFFYAVSFLIHWQATHANTRKAGSVYVLFCAFKLFEMIESLRRLPVIRLLKARNVKLANIHRQIREVYDENAKSDATVRKLV